MVLDTAMGTAMETMQMDIMIKRELKSGINELERKS